MTDISPARQNLIMLATAFKGHLPTEFLLAHGRDYTISPHSFKLPRGEIKQCYRNASRLALSLPHLTYVEGKIACHGIPLDHAWCVDEQGIVVDPTIQNGDDGHVSDYFGVPFRTDYLRKAMLWNGYYGLLDFYTAKQTAPKLYELGLEAGQEWVMNYRKGPARKRKRA